MARSRPMCRGSSQNNKTHHDVRRQGRGVFSVWGYSMARVLIVDDSPTEMYKLTAMLEKHGHQVLKAENGADGVALARQEKPDAVLMDIVMPGLNGFQATRQLTKDPETSAIPVIIITTKDQETDKVWGTRQGARDYLTKPVDEDTLVKTLNAVLAG
ncbi:Response regulator PleD [compost metagenome]